ncbi:tetratricopeptide repeat domain-containing protein [Rutstroemia sp. NJR-2017a WRK4]|nr:tetratricopeptide repeat domain-containing protein [Rutstroemia sp. NJR-2017a WRK4]
MADPFSILAGAAGLADVCIRLAKFLKDAKDGFRLVDQELEDLAKEIASLQSVNESINELLKRSYPQGSTARTNPHPEKIRSKNWRATNTTLASCQLIVERIEAILKDVVSAGSGKHIKRDQVRKWLKQQSRKEELNTLREKLKAHQVTLQLSLSAIGMSAQILIGKLDSVIESAQKVVALPYLGRHFYTPQTVSSIFTGRDSELEVLKKCLFTPSSAGHLEAQKRFVVFGLAGSGKTQFCCKFAADNKQSFWGIFWINATSKEHAEQSFSTISTIGKVAPNQTAVKSWFSSLGPEQPWLLIIDNADDNIFPVHDCFPDSSSGTILITTRNPMLKTQGTVGPRYFEFQGLDERNSVELLLNAADESVPWISSSVDCANVIAKAMGYLPLALVHAGKTILAKLCTLETYLDFFEKTWDRIRYAKRPNATTPISDADATIYSTYELIHNHISAKKTTASEDALDLLRIFSFLDRQQIKLSIFVRAESNPRIESSDVISKEGERKEYSRLIPKLTPAQILKNNVLRIISLLSQLGYRPVLPKFLSESNDFFEIRLKKALNELSQMSLVSTSSDSGDCYSMHAAVHLWARQRPEMTLVEQAVWCQMTATILSRAILLPPLGDTEENETFRRDLLPHVRHVQQVERTIQTTFARNREHRRKILPTLTPPITSDRLVQLTKFSLVYAQGHQLEEAERLQKYVADIAIKYLGKENIKTIGIMRLLSGTYWQLAQVDKAVELQKQSLDACSKVLGAEHPETLQIMHSYGSVLWLQGRIPEARKMHNIAFEGLKKTLGSDHIETLKAMGGLGRAVSKDFGFTEAISIQTEAFAGLKIKLGPSHSATLEAMDNLAMAHFDRAAYRQGQPGDIDRALELETEVFTMRVEKFGTQHYHTLWAALNLARIKAIRGEIDEAFSLFLPGHKQVGKDLGETHFIYLFGELHHARILMCAKRYEEAEQILSKVVDFHPEDRHHHPDRLLAMFSLIKCRNMLGKNETASLLQELIEGTKALFESDDHPAVKYILDGQVLSKDTSELLI